jgi:RimJ/RimL family protein N-acetyltransferase
MVLQSGRIVLVPAPFLQRCHTPCRELHMMRLESFDDRDFPRLMSWIDSREMLLQWAGPRLFTFPLDTMQLTRYLFEALTEPQGSRIFKALDDEERVVGHVELGGIDRKNQSATLCRVMVAPEARGRGLCVPMIRSVLRVGFEELAFRRIDLRVYAFNIPALHCYEQAGFVREGLLRQAVKAGDQYWDTVLMAILREEWAILSVSSGNAP